MAAAVRIECINKANRTSAHEAIKNVGGPNPGGKRWRLTIAEAIKGIEEGKWAFYVERPAGHRVDVVIATSGQGHKYLKTVADGERPDNLLSLPECP